MSSSSSSGRPGIRLAVFDLDGTLIDSGTDIALAVNAYRRRLGLGPLDRRRIIRAVGQGVRHLLGRTVPPTVLRTQPGCLREFRTIYLACCTRTTRLFPGAGAALRALKAAGVVLAIASNKPKSLSERILRKLRVRGLFSAMLCGDDVRNPKPHPQALRMLMRRFRVRPPETVMVGDSRFDFEAARRAGCRLCAVTFGFGTRAEIARYRPEWTIRSLSRLPAIARGAVAPATRAR